MLCAGNFNKLKQGNKTPWPPPPTVLGTFGWGTAGQKRSGQVVAPAPRYPGAARLILTAQKEKLRPEGAEPADGAQLSMGRWDGNVSASQFRAQHPPGLEVLSRGERVAVLPHSSTRGGG